MPHWQVAEVERHGPWLKVHRASPVTVGLRRFPGRLSVAGATIPATELPLGGTVRRTVLLAAACLFALAGCSSGGEPQAEASVTAAPSPTPTATPSLSQAEVTAACTDAIAEAAPGWSDWNFDPGAWQDDERTPAECLPLADAEVPSRGNRAFMAALLAGLERADDPRARS